MKFSETNVTNGEYMANKSTNKNSYAKLGEKDKAAVRNVQA
jgi:hypothetical protein